MGDEIGVEIGGAAGELGGSEGHLAKHGGTYSVGGTARNPHHTGPGHASAWAAGRALNCRTRRLNRSTHRMIFCYREAGEDSSSMIYRLIYLSSATAGFRESDLDAILHSARKNNTKAGVTGLLVFHDGNFLQVLEGPRDAVEDVYAHILQDPRHGGVARVIAEEAEERIFAEWEMAFLPVAGMPSQTRDGFVHLLGLRDSDTMDLASRDAACRAFLESFLLSVRGA